MEVFRSWALFTVLGLSLVVVLKTKSWALERAPRLPQRQGESVSKLKKLKDRS